MSDDPLVGDLDAFMTEHRRCGDLGTGMTETEPSRVWVACPCGARIERAHSRLWRWRRGHALMSWTASPAQLHGEPQ